MKKIIALFLSLVMVLSLGAISVSAAIDASSYTKVLFTDGGADVSVTSMDMSKWNKVTIGAGNYNGSNVTADGYLEVRGACAGEIQGVAPKVVIPSNYAAEMKAKFYSGYNHQSGIRFMTVGSTNYYFMSTYIGDSKYKYGIGTDTDLKKDMNASLVTGAPTKTLADTEVTAIAEWKIIVNGTSVEILRNGEAFIEYTVDNINAETVTPKLDCVFFSYASYSADTAKKVFNIHSFTLKGEPSAIEKAEEEMTCTLYHNDFETGSELNSGDCSSFTSGSDTIDSVGITTFDNRGVLEITQEAVTSKSGRTTAATFMTEGINDYVLEAKLRGSDTLPDSFAVRYRFTGVDGGSPKFYALGYTRWNNSNNGSFGITAPNGYNQAANYKTQLTSYGSSFAKEWHTYKIVVSGMTAATYIDGTLVDEQTMNEGYETGNISFALFDQYHSSKVSLYIDELTIKTRPVSDTRLHKVTKAYDIDDGIFRVDARVLASESEAATDATMIIAVYEEINGVNTLVKAAKTPVTITQNGVSDYVYVAVDELDTNKEYTAKVFVLDIPENVLPVTKSVALNVE